MANTQFELGNCSYQQGKHEEALIYYQSVLIILSKPPQDPKDVKVAATKFNIGLFDAVPK